MQLLTNFLNPKWIVYLLGTNVNTILSPVKHKWDAEL